MAKGQFKFTVAELTEMVDRFLEAADASMTAAAETGSLWNIPARAVRLRGRPDILQGS